MARPARSCDARSVHDAKQLVLGLGLACALIGCGDDTTLEEDTDAAGSTGEAQTGTPASSAGMSAGPGTSGPTSDSQGASSGGDPSASDTAESDTAESDTNDSDTTGTDGPVPTLPTPDGTCPDFTNGDLEFSPAEIGTRRARVFFDASTGGGGPLVFWFHGTGGSPDSSMNAISVEDLETIVAMGGMVVMPWNDPATGQFPWFLVDEEREDDLHLMDEIVGCADQGPGIDARNIHAAGFSAGALHVSQAAVRRASYLASTVAVSGGLYNANVPTDAADQVFSTMILHGGPSDDVGGFNFMDASEVFQQAVEARGGFALMCNHGGGHTLASERALSWEFMQLHPFGTDPSPLEMDYPAWVPAFCD